MQTTLSATLSHDKFRAAPALKTLAPAEFMVCSEHIINDKVQSKGGDAMRMIWLL